MNHIPDKYEHLVHYYGYHFNRTREARLIQKVYEVDRLECADCGATLRIIALIGDHALCRVFFIRRMSGNGRKLPVRINLFQCFERPLSGKADVQILIDEKSARTSASLPLAVVGMVEF